MLIQAKAHDRKSAKPDAKGPFQFTKSEKRTRVPAWVAMALTALFAYFKEVSVGPSAEAALAPAHGADNPTDKPREHNVVPGDAQLDDHAPAGARQPQSQIAEPHYAVSDEPALTVFNSSRQLVIGSSSLAPQVRSAHAHNDNALFAGHRSFAPGHHAIGRSDGAALPFAAGTPSPGRAVEDAAKTPATVHATTDPDSQHEPAAAPALVQAETPSDETNPSTKTNRAPVLGGPVRLANVIAGQAMLLALGDLLLGAHDADGDELHVSNVTASNGTLVQIDDGWSFHANAGAQTLTTLNYEISDGHAVVHQTADFHILSATRTLTPGDDVHMGSPEPDQIDALDGNDVVDAGGGDDVVSGGNGADHLVGGDGNDILFGAAGDDIIFGGAGNDIISGGDGNDRLFGEDGNDVLSGDAGDDYLSGGQGNDILEGGAGNDVLDGGAGDDHLDGGEGVDTLDYSASPAAVQVDLVAGTASGSAVGHDVVANFERIIGSTADDQFCVGADAVSIQGGGGGDQYQVNTAGAHLEITDFAVGDRIHVGSYEVMERTPSSDPPDFNDIYNTLQSDSGLPILAQNGLCDGLDVTVIEARSHDAGSTDAPDGSTSYDIYIRLSGHHDLVYVLHAIA